MKRRIKKNLIGKDILCKVLFYGKSAENEADIYII